MRTATGRKAPDIPFKYGWVNPGSGAETDYWGNVTVDHNLEGNEEETALNLLHEASHRKRIPQPGVIDKTPLNAWRTRKGDQFYWKSEFGRWLEEALAERNATGSLREGWDFPFKGGYDSYKLTPGGVRKGAAKYGLSVGTGMGLGYLGGRSWADYLYGDRD